MWICFAILLGLTALAARLTRRVHGPARVRQRPAVSGCVVFRSHYDPAARRIADRRPGVGRRPYRTRSPAPGR